MSDGGVVDAGSRDAGGRDTGGQDTGPVDVGPVDVGPVDVGPVDVGPVDVGPVDTGPVDVGLVLAAGAGRRFGGPKAPYRVDGERLVDRAVRLLREGGCGTVVVVLGAWVGEVPDASVVVNDGWESGMGCSLRAGLDALPPTADRAVLMLVDLPGMTAEAVRRVRAEGADLVQATYGSRPGHPVLLGREHWAGVRGVAVGDRGARDYLATHDVTYVEVGEVADGTDLDTRPPTR